MTTESELVTQIEIWSARALDAEAENAALRHALLELRNALDHSASVADNEDAIAAMLRYAAAKKDARDVLATKERA